MIRSNCRHLLSTFRRKFPTFKQFFAVKALPNPAILSILGSEGCGFDCSSTAEVYICDKIGYRGEDIIYTSNYTSEKDLKYACEKGVIVNLDDISLVESTLIANGKLPELMSFRLNPGAGGGRTDSETASNVLGGPDAKFGVPPHQIVDAYKLAKANGALRFGIHMMTGSCVLNDDYWIEMIERMLDTVALIRKEVNIEFEFVNIGGGLGINYKPGGGKVDLPVLVDKIAAVFDRKIAEHNMPRPNLAMENGRYMTGPFGWLVSKCHAVKQSWEVYYGLDACMANLMRPGMYGSYHYITVPTAKDQSNLHSANVVGTLCENNDWFAKQREIPVASKGDLFVIHDTGAHSHSMGFQYNGKLRAPELLIRSGTKKVDVIRERESYDSLYGNTVMPADLKK